jgi:putative ABC transport system permease protein
MERVARDFRYAVRTLRRTPAFTAVAVLTLALGIGANAAMFSVVYGILLRPLPYSDAGRLVLISRDQDLTGAHRPVPVLFNSSADMDAWQRALHALESTAFYSQEVAALSTDGPSEVIDSAVVSDTFFSTLAGPMAAGRPLGATDDLTPAVVIGDRLSRRLAGTSDRAIGQHLTLSSRSYVIVGVVPSSFQFPASKTDVWIPSGFMRAVNPRCCGFRMLGRLKPDVTVSQAAAEAHALATSLSPPFGSRTESRATLASLRDQLVGDVRPALLVLFAAVGLVLLVACANLLNLLLARQVSREREAVIRSALGASRGRLIVESLAQAAVLAAGGAATGVILAIASVSALKRWQPPGIPRLDAVHVDLPVLLFSIAIAVLTALAAGLLPVLRSRHTGYGPAFGAATVTSAPRRRRIRRVLCAAELALSLVLLIGAALLARSLVRLMQTDLGVATDHVLTASLNFAFGGRPTDAQTLERVDRLVERVRALPGVQSVGVGTALPPNASRLRLTLRRAGDTVDYVASGVAATPDYFHALGMRLVSGRLFTSDDDLNHPPVMIMNVDTARRLFGGGNPIGRTMSLPVNRNGKSVREEMTLVGIVSNVKYAGLDAAAEDAVYRPFTQQTWVAPFLVVRTTADPQALVATLGRAIADTDRGVVISDVRPLDSIVSDSAAQPRFRTALLGAIAGLALAMAIVGLYGVIAYSVAQRTKEIGIHMAVGARARDVLWMVMREGLAIAGAGVLAGIAIAVAAMQALRGLLYGVAATDALSYVIATAALFAVAIVATYVPARRAARIDPLVALRHE